MTLFWPKSTVLLYLLYLAKQIWASGDNQHLDDTTCDSLVRTICLIKGSSSSIIYSTQKIRTKYVSVVCGCGYIGIN